jgi:hypothetical protein
MTTFIMPSAPTTTTPPGQTGFNASPTHYQQPLYSSHQFYSQKAPISPMASQQTSPVNNSPTSPRSSLNNPSNSNPPIMLPQAQRNLQLRPPKSPLYMPAVLRPTDPPKSKRVPKPSPLTPPQSTSSSYDDLQGARPLSRRSTIDSGKFVGLGLSSGLGDGDVTRKHWLVSDDFLPV